MGTNRETVVEEYTHDCRLVHEERAAPDLYHIEGRHRRIQSFENPHEAQLYADIYAIIGGFTEKQTGNRGMPPAIASAEEDIRITYLAIQMSITYAARAFDVEEAVVRDAVDRIHTQAKEKFLSTDGDI